MINIPSSSRSLLLIGLAAYLLFAVVRFPASLAVAWFVPDDIEVYQASGTVWSGHADTVVTPRLTLVDTDWKVRPVALLTAKLSYRIKTRISGGAIETIASISPGGTIRLQNLTGVLPVSALPAIADSVTIDGQIGLDIEQLTLEDQWPTDARGTVDIVGLSLVNPTAETLGHFELVFAGAGESGLEGLITEVDSTLDVSGTLSLAGNKQWQLAGTVRPTPATSSQLLQGLAFFGVRNADGSYTLTYPQR